jgi:alpha-tubulin suppressor-like RCC1 family protein
VPGLSSVVEVAVGLDFACARLARGSVWCWGNNLTGQLGVPLPGQSAVPLELPGVEDAAEISLGAEGGCALLAARSVICWGDTHLSEQRQARTDNDDGIWRAPQAPPTLVPSLDGAVGLALGMRGGCVLKSNRHPTCWGTHFVATNPPVVAEHIAIGELVSIASSPISQHVCGVDARGAVRCFGREMLGNIDGQLEHAYPTFAVGAPITGIGPVETVVTGYWHSCAAARDGSVWCWGEPSRFRQSTAKLELGVTRVPGLFAHFGLSAGYYQTCARASPSTVTCYGELGERAFAKGSARFAWRPGRVKGIEHAVDIGVTKLHACAVLRDGSVWCWGSGYAMQSVDSGVWRSYQPVKISSIETAKSVVCESDYCAAILRDQTVIRWGGVTARPLEVLETEASTQVALAGSFSCVLLTNGSVKCGDERAPFKEKAVEIAVDDNRNVCMRSVSGSIFCWANRGRDSKRAPAVKVRAAAQASKLWNTTYATTADGKGFSFSWPEYEATPPAPRSTAASATTDPLPPELRSALKTQGGAGHGCAILADETVYCTGEAYTGILGVGYEPPIPTKIDAL